MSGGLDLLIVGVAGKTLNHIAPAEKLDKLFGNREDEDKDEGAKQYFNDFYALSKNPETKAPRVFYLEGEIMSGAQIGAALGYVIFTGNNNGLPEKLQEATFARIPELKRMFLEETKAKNLKIPENQVGVYAVNVYDT